MPRTENAQTTGTVHFLKLFKMIANYCIFANPVNRFCQVVLLNEADPCQEKPYENEIRDAIHKCRTILVFLCFLSFLLKINWSIMLNELNVNLFTSMAHIQRNESIITSRNRTTPHIMTPPE